MKKETKLCPKCKKYKKTTEFHSDETKASGLTSHCAKCRNKYSANYYKKHKEELIKKTLELRKLKRGARTETIQ
jgi:hypothetical protein